MTYIVYRYVNCGLYEKHKLIFVLLAAAMTTGACAPSLAAELSKDQQAEAAAFAINNDIFVLQHENSKSWGRSSLHKR